MEATAKEQFESKTDRYFHELTSEEQASFISGIRKEIALERSSRKSQIPKLVFVLTFALTWWLFLFSRAPQLGAVAAVPLFTAIVCFTYLLYLQRRITRVAEFMDKITGYPISTSERAHATEILDSLKMSFEEAKREERKKERL